MRTGRKQPVHRCESASHAPPSKLMEWLGKWWLPLFLWFFAGLSTYREIGRFREQQKEVNPLFPYTKARLTRRLFGSAGILGLGAMFFLWEKHWFNTPQKIGILLVGVASLLALLLAVALLDMRETARLKGPKTEKAGIEKPSVFKSR